MAGKHTEISPPHVLFVRHGCCDVKVTTEIADDSKTAKMQTTCAIARFGLAPFLAQPKSRNSLPSVREQRCHDGAGC
jgi:hypothetical protein